MMSDENKLIESYANLTPKIALHVKDRPVWLGPTIVWCDGKRMRGCIYFDERRGIAEVLASDEDGSIRWVSDGGGGLESYTREHYGCVVAALNERERAWLMGEGFTEIPDDS